MDPTGITAAIGLATAAYGAYQGRQQSKIAAQQMAAQAEYSAQIAALSKKQDKIRQIQAREDYTRTIRNSIRQQNLARAVSLSAQVNQGAQYSTAGFGALAGIAQEGAQQRSDVYSNFQRGEQMFAINQKIGTLQGALAEAGGQINLAQQNASLGQNLFQLGVGIVDRAPQINAIRQDLFNGR